MRNYLSVLAAAALLATPAVAQAPAGMPGRADVSAVAGGTYKVDPNHSQVVWTVDHMGFSPLRGAFGQMTGTLALDPARPAASKLVVDIPVSGLVVTSPDFDKHLKSGDFFEIAKHPTGRFVSTSVVPHGTSATITGDLTLKGVTKPVTLKAKFFGAGANPMNKAETIGFTATAKIKRSDWGLGYAVPVVADDVHLEITGAFEKAA